MNPKVLIIITGDPRTSGRPAEGIRIAAGVGTWKKAEITVYLRDAAVLALTEFPDELVDEDNFVRYLPIVGEFGRSVLVQKGSPFLQELGVAAVPYEEITDLQLAAAAAESHYLIRF
jgi:hypothetical protein